VDESSPRRGPRRGALPLRRRAGRRSEAQWRTRRQPPAERRPLPLSDRAARRGPAEGDNRLRFVFAGAASPADADATSLDRRRLAAAFYSIVTALLGPARRDLLARDAPVRSSGARGRRNADLDLVGPPSCASRRAAASASCASRRSSTPGRGSRRRGLLPRAPGDVFGGEREVWSRVVDARTRTPASRSCASRQRRRHRPDRLAVGESAEALRVGRFVAPRVLGREGRSVAPAPNGPPPTPSGDTRQQLAEANVVLVILDAARAQEFGCYGYRGRRHPRSTASARRCPLRSCLHAGRLYARRDVVALDSQYPTAPQRRFLQRGSAKDRLTLAELLSGQGSTRPASSHSWPGGCRLRAWLLRVPRAVEHAREQRRRLPAALPPCCTRTATALFRLSHFREPHSRTTRAPSTRNSGPTAIPKASGGRPSSGSQSGSPPFSRLTRAPAAALRRQPRLRDQKWAAAAGARAEALGSHRRDRGADHGEELFERG